MRTALMTAGTGLALAIALVISPGLAPASARAAVNAADPVPAPPDVAAGVYSNGLTGSEIFQSGTCRTGQAFGQNVGEGFKLTVRGRCVEERTRRAWR